MILNLLVIAIVALVAYMWTGQGVFSAFLHFVCVLVAGAVAFAVWEPVVYYVLMGVREDIAWSVGLMLPFLIVLVALRMASDKLVPSNLEFDNTTNFVGGAALGAASGVITVGMLVLSIGFLRVSPTFLGHATVRFDQSSGSLVKGDALWLPADRLTVALYEKLSVHGFGAGETALALRHPDLHLQAGLVRHTARGVSRTTMKPGDFEVVGTYTVVGESAGDLVADSFVVDRSGSPVRQTVKYLDDSLAPGNAVIRGYVLRFQAGAVESTGQFVIGPSQVRLVVRMPDGSAKGIHPMAVISQASGAELTAGRWRFDAPDIYVGTVGARRDSPMAFEFLVPPDAQPTDLLVKNVRIPTSGMALMPMATEEGLTVAQRDEQIRNLSILEGQPVDGAIPIRPTATGPAGDGTVRIAGDRAAARDNGVLIGTVLPSGVMHKSRIGGLRVNDANEVTEGRLNIPKADLSGNQTIPAQLRVDRFAVTSDTVMVQVDVSISRALSPFGRAMQAGEDLLGPLLVDSLGQTYQPIGYVYDDGQSITIQFNPGQPITALSQLPQLSRSKPNDKLTLLFRVSRGVSLQQFTLGGQVTLAEFTPPLPVS